MRVTPARLCAGLLLLLAGATALHAAPNGFDPVVETNKYLATLPAEARAKSDAYFEGGYWLQLWDVVVTFSLMWVLYRSRVIVWLRDLTERWIRWRFLPRFCQGVFFIALYTAVMWIVNLPWDYYEGFVREHQYGLSNLTFGGWLGERAIGFLPGVILGSLVGSLLYLGIRRFPQRWWVLAGVATPFFLGLLIVISPVFIAPLFNKYTPLTDARVRDPILSLARANGVPADNVYQFDASKQTKRISANVSGAFHTIRVSLNDNLLARCSPAEVQAVMAHELGHYVMNHVYKLTIYLSLVVIAGFAFVHWFFGVVHRRAGAAWGVRGIDDFAGLPLFSASFALFMLFATPINNSIIRSTEAEADIFGLNAARQPDGFATVALKLSEYRKIAPGPWEEIIFFDHPSGRSRIFMAMQWKAEHLAELKAAADTATPPTGK
ncbi:MAG: M48 family metallopeptidase [Opitutales bacterium]